MRIRIPLIGGLGLLTACVVLSGCDPNKGSENTSKTPGENTTKNTETSTPSAASSKPAEIPGAPKFKVVTNGISPFWTAMSVGLYQADIDLKVNGDWQAPEPDTNAAQVKVIQDALASKTDGIAVSVIEDKALKTTIDDAVKAGVPVITFDSDSAESARMCYLGTNNFEAGRAAGETAKKLFPNGGKLVAFVGNMSAQNARDRYNGFKEALKGTNITFIKDTPYEDNKDTSVARKNVEDAIAKYGSQLTGCVGLYSYNGPAIIHAVQSAGVRDKMKIICFDGEPETLASLAKGEVDVTVVQKPYEFGRLSIMLLNLIKKDGGIDKALDDLKPELDKLNMKLDKAKHSIDTGVDVITPENAKPFLDKLKERGLKST